MIKLENVSFGYKKGRDILKEVNMNIEEGECISIIGKNGSREIYYCKTYIWNRKTK